ncbi:DNA cytosine methyltransferase [Micromonospora cathayae]|uniref:DNA cytosine methyltransferase n=1 Tax=Micromonospora cathayae TaxID=3028804 RepID=A0ABY7ZYQ1_9ACTN|nr:DNA cytosine methyltransferase [Micromonospora sp. HUAS 3]WDZ87222.1 DNA cytosine methyltransferase [Micromonospora sp. HUAS 3]
MNRPIAIDLYCGEGGASMGYHRAGFHVIGVDLHPQPRYPFTFHQGDALTLLPDLVRQYRPAAVAASPTCQTRARVTSWRGKRENHPDLLTPTLDALDRLGLPYVVENVPEAAWDGTMRPDYLLCGTQFGLNVRRHRVFQRGHWAGYELLPPCRCYRNPTLLAFEHKGERAFTDALGCHWMTNLGGRQAIPPACTEHIGRQLLVAVTAGRAAA